MASTPPPELTQGTPFRVRYWPGLDGLRGVAILVVILYHAFLFASPTRSELDQGLSPIGSAVWALLRQGQSGYVGVVVFFALSGFLITALLVSERGKSGTTSFRAFYARRALRLLPALCLLLVVGAIYAALRPSAPAAHGYWGDAAATLFYVMNWVQASHAQFQTHFLSHAWSLSIEEQFYALWPLVFVVLIGRAGDKRIRALVVVALLALGSALLRLAMWLRGASITRIYYGLDTRGDALLIGCLLGLLVSWGMLPTGRVFDRLVHVAGWLGILALGVIATLPLHDAHLMYDGLYTVVPLATVAVILAVVNRPSALLSRVMSVRPLVAIGKVSYGLYLWHFPVFLVLGRSQTHLSFVPNLILELVVTVAITVASYNLLEKRFLRLKGRYASRVRAPHLNPATV